MIDTDRIMSFVRGAGHTEYSVCKELKWGNGVISRWRSSMPSVDKLVALSKLIDVPVYELLGDAAGLPTEFKYKIAAEKFGSEIRDYLITTGRMTPDEDLTEEFWSNITRLTKAALAFQKPKEHE